MTTQIQDYSHNITEIGNHVAEYAEKREKQLLTYAGNAIAIQEVRESIQELINKRILEGSLLPHESKEWIISNGVLEKLQIMLTGLPAPSTLHQPPF